MSTPNLPEPAASSPAAEEPIGRMSFFEHLSELRTRLIHACAAIALGAFIGVAVAKHVIGFVMRPMVAALQAAHLQDHLINTNPTGVVSLVINLGLYLGVVIASPYVLYQVWLFVAPGLYKHEQKAVAGFIVPSVLLFLSGIAFSYYVILPYLLRFLVSFQSGLPLTPMISINEYFDLVLIVLLGVGVIFELPMVILILSLFGIVTPAFLWKNFRYAILIITIVAAIITPTPDATTMLVFMAPMILLYIIGIAVSWAVLRRKRNNELAREGAH
jgi:sec-independent protein translocase protein TatC